MPLLQQRHEEAWQRRLHSRGAWPALLEAALVAFLRNDLHFALTHFLGRAQGSFGIAAQVSLWAKRCSSVHPAGLLSTKSQCRPCLAGKAEARQSGPYAFTVPHATG